MDMIPGGPMTRGTECDRQRGPMERAGGRMSSLRTGAIGDGLIQPGPGVPTVMPGSACACPTGPATTTGSEASGFLTRPRERESSGSGDAGAEMTGADSTSPRRTLRRSVDQTELRNALAPRKADPRPFPDGVGPTVILVANSGPASSIRSLGRIGTPAKGSSLVSDPRAEFNTSVNSRVTSRHLRDARGLSVFGAAPP